MLEISVSLGAVQIDCQACVWLTRSCCPPTLRADRFALFFSSLNMDFLVQL